MRMKKLLIVFIFSFLTISSGFTQQVFQFTKGLWTQVPMRYGREALYTDLLAYQLYSGTLKTPANNALFNTDEKGVSISWKEVTADTLNRLIRPGLTRGSGGFGRGGYFYLTYDSKKEGPALLNIKGNSGVLFNGRSHAGDPYSSGWLYIPVQLKKGINELYVRGNIIQARLSFPSKKLLLNVEDPTVPSIVLNNQDKKLKAAIVVINTNSSDISNLQIVAELAGKKISTAVPVIPALSTRKVMFEFDASGVTTSGKHGCEITLNNKKELFDRAVVEIEAVEPGDKYSNTFVSNIDGSLQYFAVAPQVGESTEGSALFLSVHGAGVEAIGQARAYKSKDWGTIVTPTNRRPRGFNWEDWGRLDALEVLNIAKDKFKPDPQQVYLTGHSMGGHGTWFLGATYPDKWAAIAPCAGYPTLKGYGSADGIVPDSSNDPLEQLLLRASNQSDVVKLVSNYKPLGVYIFHGDADRVVPVTFARQMKKELAAFHSDLSYYEYPGGEHWFGDHSVDWKPIFDFFKWHKRKVDTTVNQVDFTTSNPGISSGYYWASIIQQDEPLKYSRMQLTRNLAEGKILGTTTNSRLLKFDLSNFGAGVTVKIQLDGSTVEHKTIGTNDHVYLLNQDGKWNLAKAPSLEAKGPHRNGTLKDAFNNRMVFVYSTGGTKQENEWSIEKARYDAETWYYRGNGAVDIVADKDFSVDKYKDRGVIIYGNKTTNKAWNLLLGDSPIQVERNRITAGTESWQGDDLSAYFVRPIKGSEIASVGVISGTGIKGMNAAIANQYFAGASGFPDFMIYKLSMLKNGASEVQMAGFFDNEWKLQGTSFSSKK